MLKKARLLTHPPRRAKTRRSASKAAADESTGGVAFFTRPPELPRQLVSQVGYVEDDFEARTMPGERRVSARRVGRVRRATFSASCVRADTRIAQEQPRDTGAEQSTDHPPTQYIREVVGPDIHSRQADQSDQRPTHPA
jgi:hypothetical protein